MEPESLIIYNDRIWEGFDKTSNNNIKWENISNGPVYSSFRMRQQIRNSVVEQTITVYNQIKKIDINVALLNWDGVLYREYRMALPLNMNDGEVSYEVPYGVSVVGKMRLKVLQVNGTKRRQWIFILVE